ncbi:MAG: insulinase family protein [Spirochaetales bacterium]|jgi:zinc protease|nr:insulinase family protein [Spirochaetales bacterium]
MRRHLIFNHLFTISRALILALCLGLFSCAGASLKWDEALPLEESVITGRLDSGLTYYIRQNREPEGRASLRLVVRAGSNAEEDDQQGYAHLTEHMAFNGTRNFEKTQVVRYLESIGMTFGPDVNAYTSFDETVYMLEIPTDDSEIVEQAFQILEDWSHDLKLDEEEIAKERGVVQEEWRLRRGAAGRIFDELYPVLFAGSRYAQRLPIGKMDVVMQGSSGRLRDFYQSWYRPELMAVIAVGDFDPQAILTLIKEKFDGPPAEKPVERPLFPLPVNETPAVKITADPEMPQAAVALYIKTGYKPLATRRDYRDYLIRQLFFMASNERLQDWVEAGGPVIAAGTGEDLLIHASHFLNFQAILNPDSLEEGILNFFKQVVTLRQGGITQGELDRSRTQYLSMIDSLYRDRESLTSSDIAGELTSYDLDNIAMPGYLREWELCHEFLPGITLEEVNRYSQTILPPRGRVLSLILPEGAEAPSEEGLLDLLAQAETGPGAAFEETFAAGDLISALPPQGRIQRRESLPEGVEILTLENGTRIVYKRTNFREDEILFSAYSPGGLSRVSEADHFQALCGPDFLEEGGLGSFSAAGLRRVLSGKRAGVSPSLERYYETFSGWSSPGDLETLFQLLHLYFTAPRFDRGSFENYKNRLTPLIARRLLEPETVYRDRINELITQGSPRTRPLDSEILSSLDRDTMEALFRDRFFSPGEWTFFFVGNIDPAALENLALSYLGSLPPGREEAKTDLAILPPEGIKQEALSLGREPKAQVTLIYSNTIPLDGEQRLLAEAAAGIVETRLRETLREDLSGTYSIRVQPVYLWEPRPVTRVRVSWGCDPARVEELTRQVQGILEEIKTKGVDPSYLAAANQQFIRGRQVALRTNEYWLNHLTQAFQEGEPRRPITKPEDLSPLLQPAAFERICRLLFPADRYVRVDLMPGSES